MKVFKELIDSTANLRKVEYSRGQQKTPLSTGEFSLSKWTGLVGTAVLFVPHMTDSTDTTDLFCHGGGTIVTDRTGA